MSAELNSLPPCPTGKRRFTRHLARAALRGAKDRGRDEHHAYKCPTCGFWHLSSSRMGRRTR